jgi:predicted HicB family RNase H-like nuclease
MRIDPEDKERWEKLAAARGMSLSAWISMWANLGAHIEESRDNDLRQRP